MARPTTIDDETILCAAREIFEKFGFGATTAQVARHAGVSEGSVFRRYPSKQALFEAAMGLPEPEWISGIQTEPREHFWSELETLAHEIIAHMTNVIPKVILMHGAMLENKLPDDAVPIVAQKRLVQLFKANADRSPIVARSEEAARIFFGALHSYVFADVVGVGAAFNTDTDRYVETLLSMLGGPESPS